MTSPENGTRERKLQLRTRRIAAARFASASHAAPLAAHISSFKYCYAHDALAQAMTTS